MIEKKRFEDERANNMFDELRKALVVGGIAAVVAFITAFVGSFQQKRDIDVNVAKSESQARAANEKADIATRQVNQLAVTSLGSLEKGQKLCRVLQGKAWRDGLIVPQNWTVSLCVDYMKKTGGSGYQLGCIYS